jgi:hypothetical protein
MIRVARAGVNVDNHLRLGQRHVGVVGHLHDARLPSVLTRRRRRLTVCAGAPRVALASGAQRQRVVPTADDLDHSARHLDHSRLLLHRIGLETELTDTAPAKRVDATVASESRRVQTATRDLTTLENRELGNQHRPLDGRVDDTDAELTVAARAPGEAASAVSDRERVLRATRNVEHMFNNIGPHGARLIISIANA